jgi:hypothetical protein
MPQQPGDRAPDQQHLRPPLEPNREGTALAQATAQMVLTSDIHTKVKSSLRITWLNLLRISETVRASLSA